MAKRKERRGAKTKLTRELVAKFGEALRTHASKRTACEFLGIEERTFYRWLEQGRDGTGSRLHRQLCQGVERAQAESKMVLLDKIGNDPSWQASAWILERLHHGEFGRKQTLSLDGGTDDDGNPKPMGVEHSGDTGPAVTIQIANPDDVWNDDDDTPPEAEAETAKPARKHVTMPGDTKLDS